MHTRSPHFLLYAEAAAIGGDRSRWKFVLQAVGSDDRLTAADTEPVARPSRLELLAVVRGLEALDQPSRVTLLTRSRYVARGLRRELSHWRERRWRWEHFGQVVPIRDHDLWQRIDRALEFHQVECCAWHAEEAMAAAPAPAAASIATEGEPALLVVRRHSRRRRRWSLAATWGRLRQNILIPFSAIWRPAFTRAA
jgi:ribonuclease HI